MSNNTDPKIQEIKERHASIMPEWHYNGNEIVLLSNPYRGIGGFLDEADNVFASNAPWDIAYLLSVIERLQTFVQTLEQIKQNEMQTYGEETGTYHIADTAISHLKG